MKHLFILPCLLALGGCASVPGGAGSGAAGTSSMVNGIEVWEAGPPPRPYRVIGAIERQGADPSASYRQEEEDIAGEARQRGADAVILQRPVMVVIRMDLADGRPILAPKVEAELIKYQ